MSILSALFKSSRPIPAAYRSNFKHLYFDIAWFGLLSGSTIAFLSIYAARIGANGTQVGLINAGPALINLFVALPFANWMRRKKLGKTVFWSAWWQRIFYVLLVPLPMFFLPRDQIWLIIIITLIMSIPGTGLAVGFNTLFAEAVPGEWRAYVTGIRNVLLSLTYIISSIVCGILLKNIPFPLNYEIVFGIGFVSAMLSSIHLLFVKPTGFTRADQTPIVDTDVSGKTSEKIKSHLPGKLIDRIRNSSVLRGDVLGGPVSKIIYLLFGFYFSVNLAIPVFSIYMVTVLKLNDQNIGLGTAVFYITTLIGSTQLDLLTNRMSNRLVMGIGAIIMAFYPGLMAFSRELGLFLLANAIGGIGWALAGGAVLNYLLEFVPSNDRPAHLAWYNIAMNAGILFGSVIGPLIAGSIGLRVSLIMFAFCRMFAGLFIIAWGKINAPNCQ
jgi:MFS family permease